LFSADRKEGEAERRANGPKFGNLQAGLLDSQKPGQSLSSARIEELRKKFDENPRRYFAPLANEYRKVGDFDQAIFICQEYLPQQPGHMSGHIVFGQALFEAKRLPEAKTVFETALSLDPENLIALRHLADISRDLGDTAAAKTWYERVLQADPRNDEVIEIMAKMAGGEAAAPAPAAPSPAAAAAAAAAPTAEVPAKPTATKTMPDASSAPTMELSASAVQEMLKARQAAKAPAAPAVPELEPMSLDSAATIEINAISAEPAPMEGLEATSLAGTMDLPTIEPLGLETTSLAPPPEAAAPPPAPLDGLDTISLDDMALPSAPATTPAPVAAAVPDLEPVAPSLDDDLLDLGSIGAPPAAPAAPAAAAPSPADTPIDGGHDSGDLLDLDISVPSAPPAQTPEPSTLVMEAVKSVIPAVQDAVEAAAPALMDLVDTAVPAVVDAVKSTVEAVVETPTIVMDAIKAPAKSAPPAPAAESRTSQSIPFVTETMAQLYLSQGHREEAKDIYRKLIDARPHDAELKARLAAIEKDEQAAAVAAKAPAPAPAAAPAMPAGPPQRAFNGSGPSIRQVLRDLFGLDGSATYSTAAAVASSSTIPAEVGSIDMLFSADPVPSGLDPLAAAFDGGYVASQGSIDDVFAASTQ
jgi:tetratricopeptide (TPR) repeat protein